MEADLNWRLFIVVFATPLLLALVRHSVASLGIGGGVSILGIEMKNEIYYDIKYLV